MTKRIQVELTQDQLVSLKRLVSQEVTALQLELDSGKWKKGNKHARADLGYWKRLETELYKPELK